MEAGAENRVSLGVGWPSAPTPSDVRRVFRSVVARSQAGRAGDLPGHHGGRVQRILVGQGTADALDNGEETAIPVLIRVEPARFEPRCPPAWAGCRSSSASS